MMLYKRISRGIPPLAVSFPMEVEPLAGLPVFKHNSLHASSSSLVSNDSGTASPSSIKPIIKTRSFIKSDGDYRRLAQGLRQASSWFASFYEPQTPASLRNDFPHLKCEKPLPAEKEGEASSSMRLKSFLMESDLTEMQANQLLSILNSALNKAIQDYAHDVPQGRASDPMNYNEELDISLFMKPAPTIADAESEEFSDVDMEAVNDELPINHHDEEVLSKIAIELVANPDANVDFVLKLPECLLYAHNTRDIEPGENSISYMAANYELGEVFRRVAESALAKSQSCDRIAQRRADLEAILAQ